MSKLLGTGVLALVLFIPHYADIRDRQGQRTVAVFNQDQKTITIVPGSVAQEWKVCVGRDGGPRCATFAQIDKWMGK